MTWGEIVQDPVVVGVAAAVIAVIVIVLVVWLVIRRRRSDRLQRRFGAEYKRTVDERGSRRRAEQDLGERGERRERLDVRPLTATEREEARARFEQIQASFVDGPESAVRFADNLLEEVAELRGYEDTDSGPLAVVSVDHPEDTAVHRRRIAMLDSDQRLDTEDLRQALLSARRLLERLVREGEDAQPAAPAPPRSLLGLDEQDEDGGAGDDGGERTAASDEAGERTAPSDAAGERSTATDEPGGRSRAPEDDGPTFSARPEEPGRDEGTAGLTEPEPSAQPGPR